MIRVPKKKGRYCFYGSTFGVSPILMANNFEHTQNASLQYSFVHLMQYLCLELSIRNK